MSETFSVESGIIQMEKVEGGSYWSEFFPGKQDLPGFEYLPDDLGAKVKIYEAAAGNGRYSESAVNVEEDDDRLRNVVEDDRERNWNGQEDYEVNQRSETDSGGDDNNVEENDEEDNEEEEEEEEEEDDDDEEEDENPFFQVILESNSDYLSVPLRFCRKYIWKEGGPRNIEMKLETQRLDQIIWTVDLQPYRRSDNDERVRGARLTSGWQGFVEDNELESKDICVFKLMKNDEHEIRFCVCAYRWNDHIDTYSRMF